MNLNIKVTFTFVMPVMTRSMVDLKVEVLTKIGNKLNDFKITIMAELREQIKQVSKDLEKLLRKQENWN